MLHSKPSSRSAAYSLFGDKKRHVESLHSIKFSAPKFCRGDTIGKSVVDPLALRSLGRRSIDKKSAARFTEKQIQRALAMQEHMGQLEEELKWAKDRISIVEQERKKAMTSQANGSSVNNEGPFSPPNNKTEELLMTEIRALKELLYDSKEEIKTKDKDIDSLRKEAGKAKQFELKLKETNSILNRLRDELKRVKTSEVLAMNQHSYSKQKIEELENEVQKSQVSEAKMLDSLKYQTKLLEQEKVQVEESKLKIASLTQNIASLGALIERKDGSNIDHVVVVGKEEAKKKTCCDKKLSIDEEQDMDLLKRELRQALEAEKTSKAAMDDLAAALKEVAMESAQAKEKLENARAEAERLKQLVKRTEDNYQKVLDDSRKEAELHKNAAERFRLEAEESHFAWSDKEMGFITCIKRAEEERCALQHENNKLIESLKAAEQTARTAREENYKLRDILKQAINEANAAKATSGIAKDENTQLKDLLVEKDEAMHFLTQENERLRISEAAAYENIKEFKRLLSKASKKFKSQDAMKLLPNLITAPIHEEQKKARKTISFDLGELKLYNDMNSEQQNTSTPEHPEKAEALKGTIFDPDASPRSEPRTPQKKPVVHHHRREPSSVFTTDDEENTNSEDIDHIESSSNFEDSDSDRNHTRRKTMFRRVGELLIKRTSFHRLSTDQPSPSQPHAPHALHTPHTPHAPHLPHAPHPHA